MANTKFEEGHLKKGGKKKGTPNKFTNLKQAFLDVFEKMEKDSEKGKSIDNLFKWATKNQRNQGMFYQLISKMLPTNVSAEVTNKYEDDVAEKFKAAFKDIGVPNVDEFIARFKKLSDERSRGKTKVLAKTGK